MKKKMEQVYFPQTFRKSSFKPQSFSCIKADLIVKQTWDYLGCEAYKGIK